MNAVNLLPAKHRPRTPTGGQQGSSYAVIGILGAVCVMVLLFVLTVNGINSNKESVARTKAETTQAKKRAEELAPYGNFIQVKEQRVSSVKQQATSRIDWERLMRGLAHVLPEDVWLISAEATAKGGAGAPGGSQSSPPPASGGSAAPTADPSGGAGASKPTMSLVGCASSHPSVATTLVRLRHLPAVEDVELSVVQKPDAPAGGAAGGGAPAAPGAGSGASAGGDGCGAIRKKPAHRWEAKVTFKPQAAPAPEKKVPASLGGGA